MADGEVKIPQEQIDALVAAVERIEKKRKIMLAGYLLCIVILLGGQVGAFVVVARAPAGAFVAWVYLIPFALVGLVMWLFGRWTKKKKPPGRSEVKPTS